MAIMATHHQTPDGEKKHQYRRWRSDRASHAGWAAPSAGVAQTQPERGGSSKAGLPKLRLARRRQRDGGGTASLGGGRWRRGGVGGHGAAAATGGQGRRGAQGVASCGPPAPITIAPSPHQVSICVSESEISGPLNVSGSPTSCARAPSCSTPQQLLRYTQPRPSLPSPDFYHLSTKPVPPVTFPCGVVPFTPSSNLQPYTHVPDRVDGPRSSISPICAHLEFGGDRSPSAVSRGEETVDVTGGAGAEPSVFRTSDIHPDPPSFQPKPPTNAALPIINVSVYHISYIPYE